MDLWLSFNVSISNVRQQGSHWHWTNEWVSFHGLVNSIHGDLINGVTWSHIIK
ncbi:hypothetical protein JHK84_040479 [Glycine max]|nr:hypothetical protein JHK84_040479 [Glycine max]